MCPNLAQEEEKLRQTTLELSACTYRVHVSFVKLARSDVESPKFSRRGVHRQEEFPLRPRALSVPSAISVSKIP